MMYYNISVSIIIIILPICAPLVFLAGGFAAGLIRSTRGHLSDPFRGAGCVQGRGFAACGDPVTALALMLNRSFIDDMWNCIQPPERLESDAHLPYLAM